MPGPSDFVERAASRLKFPQAFTLFLVLFLVDFLVPDLLPFIDEILLGLGTVVFGLWRNRLGPGEAPKPAEKNVTPPS
jgi:hypothetical protein